MTRLQHGLLLASVLLAAAVVIPLGVLVRDEWQPLRHADQRGLTALAVSDGPARNVVLALTQLGAPLLLELAAVVLALFLVRRKSRLSGYVLVSVLGAQVLSFGLKLVVERVRPCVDLASCPSTASFPSGHAVGAASFWPTVAVLLLPVLGKRSWWLLVVPPLVGLTRVGLGVHYPSDVVAGLVVGGCWAAASTAVFAAWRQEEAGRDVPLEEGLE